MEENLRNKQKNYIKLELDLEFEFADDITKWDYNRQKDTMIQRNRWRDLHMEFYERIEIPGYTKYNFVKIGDNNPACLNTCSFLFFTFIIPVMEFYKMYVESFCIRQDYSIKKVVSSRYNLLTEEAGRRFDPQVPKIKIYENEVNFSNAPQNFNQVYDLPTADELETSKNFNSSNQGTNFMRYQENSPVFTYNKDDQNLNQNQNFYPNRFEGNVNGNFNNNFSAEQVQTMNYKDIESNNNFPSISEVVNNSQHSESLLHK